MDAKELFFPQSYAFSRKSDQKSTKTDGKSGNSSDFQRKVTEIGENHRITDLKNSLQGEEYIRRTYEKAADSLRQRITELERSQNEIKGELTDLRASLGQEREFRYRLEAVQGELEGKTMVLRGKIERMEREVDEKQRKIEKIEVGMVDFRDLQSENDSLRASIETLRITRDLTLRERDRLLSQPKPPKILQNPSKTVENASISPFPPSKNPPKASKSQKTLLKPSKTHTLSRKKLGSLSTAAIYLRS